MREAGRYRRKLIVGELPAMDAWREFDVSSVSDVGSHQWVSRILDERLLMVGRVLLWLSAGRWCERGPTSGLRRWQCLVALLVLLRELLILLRSKVKTWSQFRSRLRLRLRWLLLCWLVIHSRRGLLVEYVLRPAISEEQDHKVHQGKREERGETVPPDREHQQHRDNDKEIPHDFLIVHSSRSFCSLLVPS